MIFLKRLLWSAATNLFAAWIMVDMFLSTDLNTVPQHSFNGSVYDFIIGKTQGQTLFDLIFLKIFTLSLEIYSQTILKNLMQSLTKNVSI